MVESEAVYELGKIKGKKNYYFQNGAFRRTENYYNGKLDSWAREYFFNGVLKKEEYYFEGEKQREREYDQNGDMISSFGY